jgi:hypothetical protein
MLLADVEGPLDPSDLAAAVRKLGHAFPALSSHVRYTPLLKRAYWSIDNKSDAGDAIAYEHHSLEEEGQDAHEPLRRALDEPVDPTHGPQLRLVHVQTAPSRHRLGLRWLHPLMDLEGGHRLLGELHAALTGKPFSLSGDPTAVHARPFSTPYPRSLRRVWQGRLRHAYYDMFEQPRVVGKPEKQDKIVNYRVQHYDAESRMRFEAVAKERSQAGPLLYTRALMVGIARTYLAMAAERGRRRSHYLFSQALPVPRQGPRPGIHGNYVTIPWIVFKESDLKSWERADAVALQQFTDYTDKKRDEATWEMLRALQHWPFALARCLTEHRIPRGAAGFTSYRFDDTVAALGDAKITNLAGVGPMNCHPGWIVDKTQYARTMTLCLTFFEDYLDTESAEEFLRRLRSEILDEE